MTTWLSVAASLISAAGGLGAVLIAAVAWRTARRTFERDHRPLVRVVAARQEHSDKPEDMAMDRVILKNIGRGPGLTGIAYDPSAQTLLADIEAILPLGDGDQESNRLGRLVLILRSAMKMNETYELYCQDIFANWHLTRFRPTPWKIECSFVSHIKDRDVPPVVMVIGTVARP